MTRVTRHEWQWVIIASALVMAVTTVPYVLGFLRSGTDWHFSGFVFGLDDGNSYIAKMAQGARGAWLFRLFYTTEPHAQRGALVYTFLLLLGKLATLVVPPGDSIALHDRLVAWYHGARIACGFSLLLVSYRFCAEFLRLRAQRRLAFLLIALGGGLGWLLALAGLGGLPIDFYSPEAFTFLNLYGLPHLAAARALLLLGMIVYLQTTGLLRSTSYLPRLTLAGGLLAGLLWLLLGLVQPLYVLVGYAILGAHLLALFVTRQAIRRALASAIVIGSISSPMVLYTAYIFRADPILAQWQRQNIILSPHPLHYLAGWGLWLAPAAVGVWRLMVAANYTKELNKIRIIRVIRGRCSCQRRGAFLIAWLAVVPLLLYLPYNLQRRFAEGVQLPIVGLAVIGLTVGLAPWFKRRARRRIAVGVAALSLPTTLLLLLGGMGVAGRPARPVFLPADMIAAFRWLGEQAGPGSAVLSSFEVGNALPAYAPVVVYLGHGPETAFAERKQAEVAAFFGAGMSDEARRALLAAGGIEYLVFDRSHGGDGPAAFDPAGADYLQWQFEAGEFAVYRVR